MRIDRENKINLKNIKLHKLVHGGQCLAELPDGKKAFIWGGLPGETVEIRLTSSKKNYVEGVVTNVLKASKERRGEFSPENIDLSTQPWAIMSYGFELHAKEAILRETYEREGLKLPPFEMQTLGSLSAYRNKVEFSFWGDDDGVHYAHYMRASHRKMKLEYPYNNLIFDQMAAAAERLLDELNKVNVRASDLKSVIFRSETKFAKEAKVAAALFVRAEDFPRLKTENMAVYFSNPKSPASLPTRQLYVNGDITLTDSLLGKNITYDVLSFFQVNLPVFELVLKNIKAVINGEESVDMFSGVGSIGLSVGSSALIESESHNIAMAKLNAAKSKTKVIHAASEDAVEHITENQILIVDPPRAGLHEHLVKGIIQKKPLKIIYLSCNPSTQARDVKMLQESYKIRSIEGFNFFPLTPHIESLVVLERI